MSFTHKGISLCHSRDMLRYKSKTLCLSADSQSASSFFSKIISEAIGQLSDWEKKKKKRIPKGAQFSVTVKRRK